MSSTVARIRALANREIGYHEGRSGGHWNNQQKYAGQVPSLEWADGQPWCATFVCWLFQKASARHLLPVVSASCDVMANGWRRAGRWSEYPAVGAQVFYGTPSDLTHTGWVTAYDADWITTIEGNTNDSGSREGDGVYRKRRRRHDAWVVGYGLPRYPEGIDSADPRFADEHPRRRPATKRRPKSKGSRGPNVDHAVADVRDAHRYAARHDRPGKASKLAKALAWLQKINRK